MDRVIAIGVGAGTIDDGWQTRMAGMSSDERVCVGGCHAGTGKHIDKDGQEGHHSSVSEHGGLEKIGEVEGWRGGQRGILSLIQMRVLIAVLLVVHRR